MGFYTSFKDPRARAEIVRYYRFLKLHEAVFRGNRPAGELALLFPRRRVHRGEAAAVEQFRALGQRLLDAHVLFDVYPDDGAAAGRYLGTLTAEEPAAKALGALPPGRSRFECPWTVRVSASRPAGNDKEIDLHFVNYDRMEPPLADGRPGTGGGIQDEKPVPVAGVAADVPLPAGAALKEVLLLTPEEPAPRRVDASVKDGRVRFVLPEILVYAVVRIIFA
jgi:hypothetical protein